MKNLNELKTVEVLLGEAKVKAFVKNIGNHEVVIGITSDLLGLDILTLDGLLGGYDGDIEIPELMISSHPTEKGTVTWVDTREERHETKRSLEKALLSEEVNSSIANTVLPVIWGLKSNDDLVFPGPEKVRDNHLKLGVDQEKVEGLYKDLKITEAQQ